MNVLIPTMILLPLAAAVLLVILRSSDGSLARWIALAGSIATLAVTLVVAADYKALPVEADTAGGPVQPRMELRHTWLSFEQPGVLAADGETPTTVRFEFYLGLDGISMLLVVLTALLSVSSVLISWEAIQDRATEFYAALLVLETGLIGVFCAFDLLLFYVFFEFTLIPLFFLIGIWGGAQRRYAAGKFFIYTLTGSLVTLLGLVALVLSVYDRGGLATPFSIPEIARLLTADPLSTGMQTVLFLMIALGFMIKVPLFPFHTWLPLAHVEAPTAGSVMLAGVLLKLGTYGFLRLLLPTLPEACVTIGVPLIAVMSVIGIIYGALCSLAQNDIKKLVAYSSVSHLGFCMLGLFALNSEGVSGSVLQMINHGLSTGGLFLLVGMVYERYHTRQLAEIGGLAARLPLISISMVFIALSSIGLPGLNGFVGEVLSLIGMFKVHPVYAVIGTTGVILGAWYLLTMVQRAFFGPLREPHHGDAHGHDHAPVRDMNFREFASVAPLAALCLWIGVAPQPFLDTIRPDVEAVTRIYESNGAATPVADDETVSTPQVATVDQNR